MEEGGEGECTRVTGKTPGACLWRPGRPQGARVGQTREYMSLGKARSDHTRVTHSERGNGASDLFGLGPMSRRHGPKGEDGREAPSSDASNQASRYSPTVRLV